MYGSEIDHLRRPVLQLGGIYAHCIETLLSAGEQAEIILVDDGSTKDDTPAICDEYAAKYPTIVKAIHQENGGHGEGVNQASATPPACITR